MAFEYKEGASVVFKLCNVFYDIPGYYAYLDGNC